jgi:O-antigen/teichoic acid export membrane protein
VAGGVQQITIIVSSLLLPQFSVLVADRREAEIRKLVEQVMPYGLMAFALLLSGGILVAGVGIPLIFGTGFSGAVRPFILLMVATMGLALFNSFMPLLSAHGSTWVLTGITIASAGVNLAAAVGLIPFFGIAGAAVATVLGSGTAAALMLAAVQIRFGLRTLRLGLLCLPVLAVALCGLWLEGLPFYLAGLGSAAVTVVALVWTFGLFGKEDLVALGGVNLPMSLKVGLSKVFSVRMS